MWTKKELQLTKVYCTRKMDDLLDDTRSLRGEFTSDTLRDLQTLVKLKDAADQKLQKGKYL